MKESKAPLDLELGLEYYASETEGIGGRLRQEPEDFIVIEISEDGTAAYPPPRGDTGQGNYVWFVMKKRKVDSITALKIIARIVGASYKRFTVAGLKDARAIAYQFACTEGVDVKLLSGARTEYVQVLSVFRRPFKLMPGMLFGNMFSITVRGIEVRSSEAEKRIEKILDELEMTGGAPNYYGYQRFGTVRPNTHKIGRYLLKGMFKEAFEEAVLKVYPNESPWAKEARIFLAQTGDFEAALKKFPLNLHHERVMLRRLARRPGDYIGAFRALPLSIRRLFIGAYQSYLFNRVLSRRIRYGLRIDYAYPGDYVAVYSRNGYRVRLRGTLKVTDTNKEKLNELIKRGFASLVINVFGYRTRLAGGVQGEIERSILREEGISLADFEVKSMPEAASKGDIRRCALNPMDFAYSISNSSAKFSFTLLKGSYATVLLREFMKPHDIVAAGL